MELEVLITPHTWLQLSPEIRNYLAKEFKLTRSSTPRCVTQGGISKIESDGFTVDDLRGLNEESMRAWTGSQFEDLHALLAECAEKAYKALHPPEPEVLPEVVENSVPEVKTPVIEDLSPKRGRPPKVV